jgi:hypothetical protein
MSKEDDILELVKKAEEIDKILTNVSFRVHRNRKSINTCKKTCEVTNLIIGEINDRTNKYK